MQTTYKIIIYLNYEVNKESITLNFCENKNKPKLKCHGKCHLNKQLKEEDKQEKSSNTLKEITETQFFFQPLKFIFKEKLSNKCDLNYTYILRVPEKDQTPFFHPPTVFI